MTPIKIQCDCGQRYAFDVEPVDGSMPFAVVCPTCGSDGTAAANEFIAQIAGARLAAITRPTEARLDAPTGSVVVEEPPVAATTPRGRPGQDKTIDTIQITHEARAKMMWGDAPEDVVKFLMIQGLPYQEASKLSQALFLERAAAVRGNGIRKIVTGVGMMCVPVVVFVGFKAVGFLPLKIFGLSLAVGLWGAYRALKGTIMFVSPKSEPGDVSEQ